MKKWVSYTVRSTCRVCGAAQIEDVFSLGDLFVSDFPKETDHSGVRAPLDLVLCGICKLLQLKHTVCQDFMYARHYWYRSGLTATIRAALNDVVRSAESLVELTTGDVVLDIGANDGTLLAMYRATGIIRVGCEPADNLIGDLREVTPHVIHDFWSQGAFERMFPAKKAKIVTAIGMFYDMENPNEFVRGVGNVLADDGIFIAQLMCLRPMLEKNDIGNICHEHLEYFSLESLRVLFEKNGLEVFRLEENDLNGGSYRLYCRRYETGSIRLVDNLSRDDYLCFLQRVNAIRAQCVGFIENAVSEGKKVFVYGASTKGNTILQYFGLTARMISGAGDSTPGKWGRCTVGTSIPIMSEADAAREADYFLVLPWAFLNEILERQVNWRRRGGKFIVPFPEFRVV